MVDVWHVKGNMIDIINKHIESKKGVHIKKGIQPFGWDVVVDHLQKCADEERVGAPYGTLSYQLNQAEEIEDVKKVIDYLNEDLSLKIFDARIFTSFTKKSPPQHRRDNHNVLLWAVTDNMNVKLYDDESDEPWYDETLLKGDVFYIPANIEHKIEVSGARALVSFGIEVEPGIKYIDGVVNNPYYTKGQE